jgi:hypothetical protein
MFDPDSWPGLSLIGCGSKNIIIIIIMTTTTPF